MRVAVTLVRTCAVLTVLSTPAWAQSPRVSVRSAAATPTDTLGPPIGGFVMQGVALTPAQKARVRELNRRYYDERTAMTKQLAGHSAGDSAVRAKLDANIDRMMAEERAVLTPAQQLRFDKNVAAIHASWRARQAR